MHNAHQFPQMDEISLTLAVLMSAQILEPCDRRRARKTERRSSQYPVDQTQIIDLTLSALFEPDPIFHKASSPSLLLSFEQLIFLFRTLELLDIHFKTSVVLQLNTNSFLAT